MMKILGIKYTVKNVINGVTIVKNLPKSILTVRRNELRSESNSNSFWNFSFTFWEVYHKKKINSIPKKPK